MNSGHRDRTRVYIDGFNLYYGCIKGTSHRWFDLRAFIQREFPGNRITTIRYFTAHVIPRPGQPHDGQNQQIYLRVLAALPDVQVHLGHFLTKRTRGLLIDPATNQPTTQVVDIQVPEEKGTDVNLASYLLYDGMKNMYDVAIVVSNDTDLAEPVRMVREALHKRVGVLSPAKYVAFPLRDAASFCRPVRRHLLSQNVLPLTLTDADGTITKPPGW